ncbi:hypothetical protein [Marinobacter salicampi]|uniref:hypothetical protein n=1 Tax=Marinobacter salicampi TaxID=435907 RepID=UPI00140B7CBD|nr:hypothetical protein [Marinobacter salicampi]
MVKPKPDESKMPQVTLVAFSALALFFLGNYLARYVLGLSGLMLTLVIALGIGLVMGFSTARILRRYPSGAERARLLWIYGGGLGALFFAWAGFVFLSEGFNESDLLLLMLHYLPYPVFAFLFLSNFYFSRFLPKSDRN